MVSSYLIRIFTACAMAILLLPLADAQGSPKPQPRKTQTQQPSFVDFALAGVNSKDHNYGQCFDEARRLLIQETFDRAYFWSSVCSILVAGFLFLVALYQRQCQRRSEQIASEAIAQYHNALERAEAQIKEATNRNHALIRSLTSSTTKYITEDTQQSRESVTARRPIGRPAREDSAAKPPAQTKAATVTQVATSAPVPSKAAEPAQPVRPAVTQTKADAPAQPVPVPSATNASATSRSTKSVAAEKLSATDQMGLFGGEMELINKINLLQQQLSSSQEREKHLRRQLNDSELRFQKEQEKTRTLQT